VQALNLRVERFDADSVTLRLPQSDQLSRAGGMLCGQAMMAAADTAMVLALINHFGQFRPCSTVQLSSSFMKPLSGQDEQGITRTQLILSKMPMSELKPWVKRAKLSSFTPAALAGLRRPERHC
jgi:hypothetical protein